MTRADEQRQEEEATQRADREYGLTMLNRASEPELREAMSYEHRTNGFRPDETDLFRDLRDASYFEQSEWENDPTMRGRW